MLPSWRETEWGELATLEYGKGLRGYENSVGEYRVYGTNGPIGWHTEYLCDHPGVIVGRKGAYRGIHYSPDAFYVIDTAFFLEPKPGVELDQKWAYYNLLTRDINRMDSGSAIPSTSRDEFYRMQVKVPPLDEQRAIAGLLSSLDDKIDLNRRMNRTLESLARAIFTAWFVDFEPVKAKAAGATSFPGMPREVFEELPGGFIESENGPIPAGWERKPISELFEVNPSRRLSKGTAAPYLEMANMPTHGHAPDEWVPRPFGSGMRFINGDTLVARITPCLENGKTAFVDFLENDQIGWGSTEYIVLRPKLPLPPVFGYCLARTSSFRDFLIQNMSGTSGRQRVPATALEHFQIAEPPATLAELFDEVTRLLFAKAKNNRVQSKVLSEIRDALLPKLLSGQVRVLEELRRTG